MDTIIGYLDDEDAYDRWVSYGWIPDCPDEADFESVAEDPEQMREQADFFRKLLGDYMEDECWFTGFKDEKTNRYISY